MSISLKVVSMAFVFWASFNLSAILSLILFIGTLVSDLEPFMEVGAFLAVVEVTPLPPEGGGVEGAEEAAGFGGAYLGASAAGVGVASAFGASGAAALGAAGADDPLASGSIE